VLTKRSSLVSGSISIPIGGVVKAEAKGSSTGVFGVPKGRPVAGSISIRPITLSSVLV